MSWPMWLPMKMLEVIQLKMLLRSMEALNLSNCMKELEVCVMSCIQNTISRELVLHLQFSDGYNSYVEVVGHYIAADVGVAVKGKEGANKMRNSTKFINFLSRSAETDDEQWEGSDLLYPIINDIVRAIMIC